MHLRSKTVQQLLSVILSVVMILSMLPMEVLAQETPPVTTPMDLTAITEDTSGDGWSWTQSTKTLTLTGLTLTVSDDSTHALILPDGGHHRSGRRYHQHPHRRQQIHRIQQRRGEAARQRQPDGLWPGLAQRHAGYVHPRHADGGV